MLDASKLVDDKRCDFQKEWFVKVYKGLIASRYSSDFPDRVFLKHKSSKMTGDCCVIKLLWRNLDGKHVMRFQSETSVLKFLWRSVQVVSPAAVSRVVTQRYSPTNGR